VEISIDPGSAAVGQTLGQALAGLADHPLVLAVRTEAGYISPPGGDLVLGEGNVLIVLGGDGSLRGLAGHL
jgi:uncharacterized protein with PhoU and TrkA domain